MTQEINVFKELLRNNGHFFTQPRLRLFGLLQKHNALTVAQLVDYLDQQDQATVYRNIKLFESLGIINRLRLGPASVLELSDKFEHHHHHFSCVTCGTITVLPELTIIEETIGRMAQELGFSSTDHQLEIRGYCSDCRQRYEAAK